MKNMAAFIVQEHTGAIDGYYFNRSLKDMLAIVDVWQKRYPKSNFLICFATNKDSLFEITDNIHLPTIYHLMESLKNDSTPQ